MKLEPQLYMWEPLRRRYIGRHDFYLREVRSRLLSQFNRISEEADDYAQKTYEELGRMPGGEDSDMSAMADIAFESAQEFYGLLSDLKEQVVLSSLAGMYHQWEKDLRDFIEKELRHNYRQDDIDKLVWKSNIKDIFHILEQFGWDCRSEKFFEQIDACRLIVNVYKHGKGQSLTDLKSKYPNYLNDPFEIDGTKLSFSEHMLDYEWLAVSQSQFDEMANAVRIFWEKFPERLYLVTSH